MKKTTIYMRAIRLLKITSITLSVFILISGIPTFTGPHKAFAWDDCPFGLENDPYPGQCGRYVDTNNNGICDHSESKPTNKQDSAVTNENEALPSNDVQAAQSEIVTTADNKEDSHQKRGEAAVGVYNQDLPNNNVAIALLTAPLTLLGIYLVTTKLYRGK